METITFIRNGLAIEQVTKFGYIGRTAKGKIHKMTCEYIVEATESALTLEANKSILRQIKEHLATKKPVRVSARAACVCAHKSHGCASFGFICGNKTASDVNCANCLKS